ncbi:GT2D2 protein, partial [Polyodon spathula]|nr:GT2D2 protein [Polyodon spathula]
DRENRVFHARWEREFLFTEYGGKPLCLICMEFVSVTNEYNLNHHYSTNHKAKYDRYTGDAGDVTIADLKDKVLKQQSAKRCAVQMAKAFGDDKMSYSFGTSTDVSDASQLLIYRYIRTTDSNFNMQEELMKLASLYGTIKGSHCNTQLIVL